MSLESSSDQIRREAAGRGNGSPPRLTPKARRRHAKSISGSDLGCINAIRSRSTCVYLVVYPGKLVSLGLIFFLEAKKEYWTGYPGKASVIAGSSLWYPVTTCAGFSDMSVHKIQYLSLWAAFGRSNIAGTIRRASQSLKMENSKSAALPAS